MKKIRFERAGLDVSNMCLGTMMMGTQIDEKTSMEELDLFVDMGGTFDLFSEISQSDYTDLSEEQLANRKLLKQAMEAHGFAGITEEWWHFTLKDEPYPDTYFDFPVSYESFK